ncbi:MAG: galactose mutarotase [Clostridiales bacterium]|jgi:aldose 1-epimerase|nr:galactose mutarotase [Clostridiales bacterium]
MGITQKYWGGLPDGRQVHIYEFANASGMKVRVADMGCAIVSLQVPDAFGVIRDVVFGFDNPADYAVNPAFFGVVVGRVANRIANGTFALDGVTYKLEKNDGNRHHLHGGSNGFDKKIWTAEPYDAAGNSLTFRLTSPDGDSGYPGELTARVTYTLAEYANKIRMDYSASTPAKTVCNLTNHTYFNLEGHAGGDIGGHEMQIFSGQITAIDDTLIPTGEYLDVTGTPFDFREPKAICRDIERTGGGYDHNYILDGEGTAARARAPRSGIVMEVRTSSPGMQFYSGNSLTGDIVGKDSTRYLRRGGFCLETQFFPDSVNKPGFPSCAVEKDKPQHYYTEFIFE